MRPWPRGRDGGRRVTSRLPVLGLLLEAALFGANPPPAYNPPSPPSEAPRQPGAAPAPQSYPPHWYYDPYTQGITALPQRGGD